MIRDDFGLSSIKNNIESICSVGVDPASGEEITEMTIFSPSGEKRYARSQRVFNEHPSCPFCARDIGVEIKTTNWDGELDCFSCGSSFYIDFEVDYTFYVSPREPSEKFIKIHGLSHSEALESLGQVRMNFFEGKIDINKV